MKKKKLLYTALIVLGLCLVGAAFLLRNSGIPDQVGGTMMGLIGVSVGQLLSLWIDKTDPAGARRKGIEVNDERNVAIRNRAKAVSGDILQWVLIAAAWVSIGFGWPLWASLLAVAVFVLKSVLELCLIVRYQREM